MAKEIDNPASREAARQAQRAQQSRKVQGKNVMGIGAKPTQSQFGQILQERMTPARPMTPDTMETKEERAEERQAEPRDVRKAKESAQREAIQERVGERRRDEGRDQSDSRDSKGGAKKDSSQHAKEAEQRVVAKQGRGDSSGGKEQGTGKEGRQGAGQQPGGRGDAGTAKAAKGRARPEAKPAWAQGAMAAGLGGAKPSAQAAKAPRTIPQRVVDQIVQYARLTTKKDGEHEMELALHEEIFKGLRLRITTKKGKIKATFVTSSRDVRDLFLSEKRRLHHELTENGLEVEGIDVIMT